jgi:hypothetical protein
MSDNNTSTSNRNNTKRAYVSDEVMKQLQVLYSWKNFYTGDCKIPVKGTPNKAAAKRADVEIKEYKKAHGLF